MSNSSNKLYQEKLIKLIEEGETLMRTVNDRRVYDQVKENVDKLKAKLFQAKINDELR